MLRRILSTVLISAALAACSSEDSAERANASEQPSLDAASAAQAVKATTAVYGYVDQQPGSDHNRCVPDAANVLTRLNARGDLLGLHYSTAGYTPTDGETWHAQGIARLPYYSWDSVLLGQYFVEVFDHSAGTGPDNESHLGVAILGFTGGNNGMALGTNRSYNMNWNGDTADWNVTPNPSDTFIAVNGTPKYHIDPYQNHVGGVSSIGWYVAMALQKWNDGLFGGSTPDDSQPLVKIFNFWNPDAPTLATSFLTKVNGNGTDNMAAAITKLANGKFLLAVIKSGPIARVEFYVSATTNLDDPALFGTNNREPDAIWANNPGWQGMNFITDCTGVLYLMGFNGGSQDQVDYKRVDFFEGGITPDPYYRAAVTSVGSKHMYCSDNSNTDQCDMSAATGSYVDPAGHVVVYATGYGNDGGATKWVHGGGNPWFGGYSAFGGYVRGVEFHERHGNSDPSSACPTLDTAWVEFYENSNFNNYGGDAGQYYRIDYNTRDAKDGHNMGTNYFNDKATSVRWCIPSGHSFQLFKDAWSGSSALLTGSGNVRYIANLNSNTYPYGGGNVNDSITSYYFRENYVDSKGWLGTYDSSK